jgi:hypothetical protein
MTSHPRIQYYSQPFPEESQLQIDGLIFKSNPLIFGINLQLLVMCDFDCAEKIAEYKMLWLKLGKLTEDLGNCMG